jgi:acyl-CoA synthetase (NDP forming)
VTSSPPAGRNHLLPEPEALRLLEGAGLPVIPHRLARTAEEAAAAARTLGCPVAAKLVAHALAHKSDVGGVILNLATVEEAAAALTTLRDRLTARVSSIQFQGAVIAKMAPPGGLELILGMVRDFEFGPAVMFGLGGVFVEVYNDVVFRLPPLTLAEARTMLTEVKAARLLTGYRGHPPRDLASLAAGACALARLAADHPEIQEIDLNPIIAYERGCVIVDAKILVRL